MQRPVKRPERGAVAIQLARNIGAEGMDYNKRQESGVRKELRRRPRYQLSDEDFERRVNNLDVVFGTGGGGSVEQIV